MVYEFFKCIADIAPAFTAAAALSAFFLAWISICVQRRVAQRRAAIDFLLKTEMDEKMLGLWRDYLTGVDALANTQDMAAFATTDHYPNIRAYLNIHELMAVGVSNKVLDDKTCYDFWSDELDRAITRTKRVIDYARSLPGGKYTYESMLGLHSIWQSTTKKLERAQDGRFKFLVLYDCVSNVWDWVPDYERLPQKEKEAAKKKPASITPMAVAR